MTQNGQMHWQNLRERNPWEEQNIVSHLIVPYPGHSLEDFHMDYEDEGDLNHPGLERR